MWPNPQEEILIGKLQFSYWGTKLKIISNQIPEVFFHFPESPTKRKQWLQGISRCHRKERVSKFNVNNALVCEFQFNSSDISMSIGKGK